MNEQNAIKVDEEANRLAEQAEEEAEKRAQKVEALIAKAEEVAYQKEWDERARLREAQKTPKEVKGRLDEITLILDAFESKEALSYRVEPAAATKPCVVWIAVKNGPPAMITIKSDNVRIEKVGTDGRRVGVDDPKISNLDDLTGENILALIENLANDWTDPEILPRLWHVLEDKI